MILTVDLDVHVLTQLLQNKKNCGHTKKRHFPYGGRESGKTWLLIIPGSVIIVTISSIQILEQNKLGIFLILLKGQLISE